MLSMIGFAEQKGNTVYVYKPNGGYMWHRVGILQSYTSTTVVIKHGSITYVCGERGEVKFTR